MSRKLSKTITVGALIDELMKYGSSYPVYIQIGNDEPLSIADVALSFEDAKMQNAKITIEHWPKPERNPGTGEII